MLFRSDRVRLLDSIDMSTPLPRTDNSYRKKRDRVADAPLPDPAEEAPGMDVWEEPPADTSIEAQEAPDVTKGKMPPLHPGPAFCIRYSGRQGDAGYARLLSMLAYFRGGCRTKVYFSATGEVADLPEEYWIECEDSIIKAFSVRLGIENIAFA